MSAICTNAINAKVVGPCVDENVELLSVLARLADYPEYNYDMGGKYTDDMDSYFKDYSSHPAVLTMRNLRKNNGISYDAVMSMGIHLKRQNDGFTIVEQEKRSLENRWKDVDIEAFLSVLEEFYEDSDFAGFFHSHKDFYQKGLDAYNENVMKYFDESWYRRFFGYESNGEFNIVIGFTNGPCSYGAQRHEKGHDREIFSVIGYGESEGVPFFDKDYSSNLIHEFCHSFISVPLKQDKETAAQQAGVSLFDSVRHFMKFQAYGNWRTVVNESVVRAATICYMLEHEFYSQDEVIRELLRQVDRNFRWMPELVPLLRKYEKKRKRYPDFKSFYPEIVSFFDDYEQHEIKRYEAALGYGIN